MLALAYQVSGFGAASVLELPVCVRATGTTHLLSDANFVNSQTLVASYSYQMSPKWISTGSIAYDVAAGESRGSSLTFSRIGLDWILHFGFGIDTSKDNVGVAFSLEPRFGPPTPTNLSYLLGLDR